MLSQVRRGTYDVSCIIDSYDALLRDSQVARDLVPDLVLRFGATPVSKPLQLFLQSLTTCRQMLIAPPDDWHDPALVATDRVQVDPRTLCEALLPNLEQTRRQGVSTASAWRRKWERLNAQARAALKECLSENPRVERTEGIRRLGGGAAAGRYPFRR